MSIEAFPLAPLERTKSLRIRAVRPEAAELFHKWLIWGAHHFWSWNGWSCSGPNAGGGYDADSGLVHPFPFAYPTYMHNNQMSADARAGGVVGRRPLGVQQSETPKVLKNMNHCGPQPKKGNPQGNPCSSLFHLFNELEILDVMQAKSGPTPELPRNLQTPAIGLFVLWLVGIALRATRQKGAPRHHKEVPRAISKTSPFRQGKPVSAITPNP